MGKIEILNTFLVKSEFCEKNMTSVKKIPQVAIPMYRTLKPKNIVARICTQNVFTIRNFRIEK